MSAAAALERAKHLCVVLLSGLGDVVHGLPVVNAIRAARPDLRVTWVAEPMPAQLLSPHPSVDDVVVWKKNAGAAGVLDLRRRLATTPPFDLTLDFNVYFKAAVPTLLSGAPVRLGFDRDRARDGIWLAHTDRLPARKRRHTQDMFLEFLDALGVPQPEPLAWRLDLTPGERAAQQAFFAPLEGPVCAVVPASANARKDWVPERHVALVDALAERGFTVVLAGGPGERETRIARMVSEQARRTPVWGMGDGVRRLLWLIAGADLVIAPDTGPVHMARAVGVPVIGLYGHTNPWRVGPYRAFEDLWVDTYDEPGERDPSTFEPRHGRMERITVENVLERVDHAIARYGVRAG